MSVYASTRRSAYGLTRRSGGVPSPRTDRVSNMLRIVSDVELGERLPQLISSLELAAREPAGGPGGFVALAEGYQVTAAAMAKLHQTDVAWIAADRAVTAAERAGDALLAAAGDFRLAHAFLPQLDVRAIPDAEDTRGGPTGSPLRRQYATKSSER